MLNSRLKRFGCALALLVSSAAVEALALQIDRAPWPTLVAESERVVHGHVGAAWSALAPDGSGRVITLHEIVVWDELHVMGRPGLSTLILTLPGGRLGRRVTVVPGVGLLEVGDEVVVLLTDTPWGWQPVGYELGIVRLSDGELPPWGASAALPLTLPGRQITGSR